LPTHKAIVDEGKSSFEKLTRAFLDDGTVKDLLKKINKNDPFQDDDDHY
jgi:hypothetical protein